MLMMFNAKAKSFHIALRGNFPAAHDFAESDTYTMTRRRAVGHQNHRNDRRNTQQNHRNDHRNHQDIGSMTIPTSDPTSDPTIDPTSNPTSAASETTVDREGDGRIRKGLESLDGT